MSLETPDLIINCGIAFFSALAGAYAGARGATHWQERREDKQREADREAVILRAAMLCKHYAQICSKIKGKITEDGVKLEWFQVNVVDISMSSSLEQDLPGLFASLGRNHGALIESLIHAEWVAKSALSVSRIRDIEYRELQSFLIKKGSAQKLSKPEAITLIGSAWVAKLDSMTKDLHEAVSQSMEQNRVCHNELIGLLPADKRKGKELIKKEPTLNL